MKLLIFSILFFSIPAIYAENKWSHESEFSLVTIDGNSESETTAAKQTTKYSREKDSATVKAAFTEAEAKDSTTNQTETSAKSSNIDFRYDRVIDGRLSGFGSYGVYSDRFAGFTQEDRSGLGLSYLISKRENQEWTVELGYQHSEFNYVSAEDDSTDSLRAASAYTKKMNENVTAGLKIEYRDAFKDGENGFNGEKKPLYWLDYEANLAVVMTSLLSLKVSYESKYQNFRPAGTEEQTDTKLTTALVAKF